MELHLTTTTNNIFAILQMKTVEIVHGDNPKVKVYKDESP